MFKYKGEMIMDKDIVTIDFIKACGNLALQLGDKKELTTEEKVFIEKLDTFFDLCMNTYQKSLSK